MMKPLPGIYLAGGAYTTWRDDVAKKLDGIAICYDPIKMSRQHAIADFTTDDLAALRRSDFCLVVQDYVQQHGAALESGFAYALDIPIVYVCLVARVESMIAGVSRAVFTDIDAALDYMKKRMFP